jgi:hypothetical protein
MDTGRHVVLIAAVAALLFLDARPAAACQSDADCAAGELCLPTPCPPCRDDMDMECPPCENVCAPAWDDGGGWGGTCETDADCAAHEVCERVALPCAVPPTCTCACPDCPPGQACPPCECPDCPPEDAFAPCAEETYGVCLPRWERDGCASDADCPAGFACEEIQVPCAATPCACACAGCAEGEECEPCECLPCEPEPCEAETYATCVWAPLECAADADCPDGFECVAQESCWGGGGGCACPPCPEGAECPPCECPDEEEYFEECEVTGHVCQPRAIACEDDAGCPAGWTCEATFGDCACACTCDAGPACEPGQECPAAPPCECEPCDCGPAESFCVAPGWGWDGGGGPYQPRPGDEEYANDGDETMGDGAGGPAEPPTGEVGGDGQAATGDPSAAVTPSADPAAGCAATPSGRAPLAGLALLLLLLGAAVLRRARAH